MSSCTLNLPCVQVWHRDSSRHELHDTQTESVASTRAETTRVETVSRQLFSELCSHLGKPVLIRGSFSLFTPLSDLSTTFRKVFRQVRRVLKDHKETIINENFFSGDEGSPTTHTNQVGASVLGDARRSAPRSQFRRRTTRKQTCSLLPQDSRSKASFTLCLS